MKSPNHHGHRDSYSIFLLSRLRTKIETPPTSKRADAANKAAEGDVEENFIESV
jgi:hypothetical protein